MGKITTAAKVGFFAVATLAAGIVMIRFVDKGVSSKDGYVVYALFDDAVGIAKHSQVRVAGIPVGSIEGVRLERGRARVDIRMRGDVPLHEDSSVSKVTSSLLGEYFLSVAPGTEGRKQLKNGDRIPVVVEGVTTDALMKNLAIISEDIGRVSKALAESVGTEEGKENLKDTLHNLAQVTGALDQAVRENRSAIHNTLIQVERITRNGEPEIAQILRNVEDITADVREMVKEAKGGEGAAGEVRQIIDKVNRASTSLEKTLENLETVSGRLERGEGTLGRLSKDEKLIDEVEGVTETVGDFVGGLNRLQTEVSLRTDYQFLASTVKSYVKLKLQPREDKYYLIEMVNDPKGLTTHEQIAVETTNPNDPPSYFERRTITRNSLRFSLQFAQRFGPFTGRFGLKESTGGVGLDLTLLDDRLEVEQDLFGFGEVVLPRWRLSVGYEFIRRIWLLGGADDILSSDRRDYFLGMQLRFNDEDLKTILPFAP